MGDFRSSLYLLGALIVFVIATAMLGANLLFKILAVAVVVICYATIFWTAKALGSPRRRLPGIFAIAVAILVVNCSLRCWAAADRQRMFDLVCILLIGGAGVLHAAVFCGFLLNRRDS